MACEMCGSREIEYTCEIEGVIMKVCSECSRFGKQLARVQTARETKTEKKKQAASEKHARDETEQKGEIVQIIVPDFASRIKKAREKTGMTQEEFAKKVAEKESVIHNLESGRMRPSIDLCRKLERILHITLIAQIEEKKEGFARVRGAELTIGDVLEKKK
ncbi:MAG: multiprotein bridging factor aMBF1 [Nanoarchaeota archaeon]